MLYYDRIDIAKGIDVNKMAIKSKEGNICHKWQFWNEGFNFQLHVCKRCLDLLLMSMNLSNVPIRNIKSSNYHCIISSISKSEAISLM